MDFKPLHKVGVLIAVLFLWSCEGAISPMDDPNLPGPGELSRLDAPEESIFGGDGIDIGSILGFGGDEPSVGAGAGIGVNSFLLGIQRIFFFLISEPIINLVITNILNMYMLCF